MKLRAHAVHSAPGRRARCSESRKGFSSGAAIRTGGAMQTEVRVSRENPVTNDNVLYDSLFELASIPRFLGRLLVRRGFGNSY